METHSLTVLEYPRFLRVLSAYAGSAPGRDYLLSLQPTPEEDPTQAEFASLTEAALKLHKDGGSLQVAHFEDPGEIIRRAGPTSSVLDIDSFALLRALLKTGHEIQVMLLNRLPVPSPPL
jgi:dsDNA-specific endonuclease/ATPase MutS2